MRSLHPSSLPLAAGLAIAIASSAVAQPIALDPPPLERRSLTDIRVERQPVTQTSPREQSFAGEFVTMRAELENFPLNTDLGGAGVSAPATSFTGPPGFEWPLNNLRGQPNTNFVRLVDLSLGPVGGTNGVINATRAIEIITATAQPPGDFYTGANLRFGNNVQGSEVLLPLAPLADQIARVSAEYYISTIDQLFSFEAAAIYAGAFGGRVLWGGVACDDPDDCGSTGIPPGPVDRIYFLKPCDQCGFGVPYNFAAARYCTDLQGAPIPDCVPHPGFSIGDAVPPPIANWSRFAYESLADGNSQFLLDRLDGAGETIITKQIVLESPLIDSVGARTSFESQGAFLLIDNIEASGPVFGLPKPPLLDCPYLDDMEWLLTGPLLGQTTRWIVMLPSSAAVINDGARGQVISDNNSVASNSRYRREVATGLLPSNATVSNDLIATVQVRTTGSTVRGLALFNNAELTARVFLGRDDGTGSAEWFTPRVYAQINPDYDPIDASAGDPYVNIPAIGVDVADSGYDWSTDAYSTLELRISASGALRVSIDGQRIYTGAGAFTNTIDTFAFESENNSSGSGGTFRIDDVTLVCDAPSCATDFDLDDTTTFADLNAVLSNFGQTGLSGFNPGDANADGLVNFTDLNAVLTAFGTTCD